MRLGIAHHFGWAVAVTASADHIVVDRRRIELVESGMPAAPIHSDGKHLDDKATAKMVADVRASAVRATSASLDELAEELTEPLVSMSLRAWPLDFPHEIVVQRRTPYEAQADSIMYREVWPMLGAFEAGTSTSSTPGTSRGRLPPSLAPEPTRCSTGRGPCWGRPGPRTIGSRSPPPSWPAESLPGRHRLGRVAPEGAPPSGLGGASRRLPTDLGNGTLATPASVARPPVKKSRGSGRGHGGSTGARRRLRRATPRAGRLDGGTRTMAKRPELLEASDAVIEDAVQYADPLVLRGLVYQLTGDESLASVSVGTFGAGFVQVAAVTDPADVDMIRSKAIDFLKSYRDSGAGDIPIGPVERLPRSVSMAAGTEVPAPELEMWLEELASTHGPDPSSGLSHRPPSRGGVLGSRDRRRAWAGSTRRCSSSTPASPSPCWRRTPASGGTWYENRYPGARVDSPSRNYTHIYRGGLRVSEPVLPAGGEREVLQLGRRPFDIRRHIEFDTEVTSLVWDEADQAMGDHRRAPRRDRRYRRANAVISAVGFLARPNVPDIPGLEDFSGPALPHRALAPDLDLTGRRVAVIGTGCTGYQLIPEIVGDAAHIYCSSGLRAGCSTSPATGRRSRRRSTGSTATCPTTPTSCGSRPAGVTTRLP